MAGVQRDNSHGLPGRGAGAVSECASDARRIGAAPTWAVGTAKTNTATAKRPGKKDGADSCRLRDTPLGAVPSERLEAGPRTETRSPAAVRTRPLGLQSVD